jgi:hypothetical protein
VNFSNYELAPDVIDAIFNVMILLYKSQLNENESLVSLT